MSTREKVIIGLMIAAIAFAGINLLGGDEDTKKNDVDTELNALNGFVVDVANAMNKADMHTVNYILDRAAAEWQKDPFLLDARLPEDGAVAAGEKPRSVETVLEYTGYLRTGGRMLAVINGVEYETGDVIEPGRYVIREITDRQVVIKEHSGKVDVLPLKDRL